MIEFFIVISVLVIIDLLMLLVMPEFYFKIGIPIYKAVIDLKEGKNIDDVRIYVGVEEKFKVKVMKDAIIYRTKFTFLLLYSIKFISIVKGEMILQNNQLKIIQRMNLSTLYFICMLLYTMFTQQIDNFGKVVLIGIVVLLAVSCILRNDEIKRIQKDIEEALRPDEAPKSEVSV